MAVKWQALWEKLHCYYGSEMASFTGKKGLTKRYVSISTVGEWDRMKSV
jgi:hypothetical protein